MPALQAHISTVDSKGRQRYYYPLIATAFGIITTFITYYGYGLLDHVEQLPIIFRKLDSSYLINDFFVNATESSVARGRFTYLMAMLAGDKSHLPVLFFILAMLSNIAVSLITYFFARSYFKGSRLAGIFAVAVVMCVHTFDMGWNTHIYAINFVPYVLAVPFLLAGIWMAFEQKVIIATVLCIIATQMHPLMGLEVGWLILAVSGFILIANKEYKTKKTLDRYSAALLMMIAVSVFEVYPLMAAPKIEDGLFISILAHFRHPHHYIPSGFPISDYLFTIGFLIAVCVILFTPGTRRKVFDTGIKAITCSIILLCVCGYLFTEVWPMRIWVIAQPFRLLFFVKWLGLILFSGTIAGFTMNRGLRLIYILSLLHPVSGSAIIAVRGLIKTPGRWLDSLLLTLSIILLVNFAIPMYKVWHVLLYITIIAVLVGYARTVKRIAITFTIVVVLMFVTRKHLYYTDKYLYLAGLELQKVPRSFKLMSELDADATMMLQYMRQNTPEDAVFLTPPFWGQTRLVAERAIVADFKAFPFGDTAMLSWYHRIKDCYGGNDPDKLKMSELDNNYKTMNDTKLNQMSALYNVSYAVLYNESETASEPVYMNDKYKLIQLK